MVEARRLLILELLKSPADSGRLVKMFLLDLDFKMWNVDFKYKLFHQCLTSSEVDFRQAISGHGAQLG